MAATCRNSGSEREDISPVFGCDSRPKTQDYTTADNVQDEFTPSEPRTHESYSMRVACCEHSPLSSYSKKVSFVEECYEETTVVQRPPKLDTTAMGTSYLV
ncbi:hypothetical protein TNCV_4289901 [Trichonephila clavipes]|nr:hypothetical protein TNCV_4289901 [Trichonephila clavipes]